MSKRVRTIGLIVSLIALLLCSAVTPRSLQANDAKSAETVIHAQWSGNEQEWNDFLAEFKETEYQLYKDGARSPYADTPITQSWTSKEMSAQALAAWVKHAPADLAGRCWTVTITGRIWVTPVTPIQVEFTIRICQD